MMVDFDYWKKLFKEDPEQFERERKNFLEREINIAPEEKQFKLTGLQARINLGRKLFSK